jgi:catechol 2,3-dioxygenase-like lactoylglutathione lyase family enzyme
VAARFRAIARTKIFAINLIVGDLDRSKSLYRDVFGLIPLDEEENI